MRPSIDRGAFPGRIRWNAWLLGALATFFYFGFIGWSLLRGLMPSGAY